MNAKEVIAGIGCLLIYCVMFFLVIAIATVFIYGSAWASSKLLPFFSILTRIVFGLVVFIFLPLSIPRATRGFSSIALFISSYVFGATLWMEGLLLTLVIWGAGAVIIGLFIAGVGVVPIAILATLFKGMWWRLIELVLLTIMTFASRFGGLALAESLEN